MKVSERCSLCLALLIIIVVCLLNAYLDYKVRSSNPSVRFTIMHRK